MTYAGMKESTMRRLRSATVTAAAGLLVGASALLADVPNAAAQEIQITGPLAGAPAVRRLRLHREDRFDVALAPTFTLLDEFRRHIILGPRATYHFTDWVGAGLFGGYAVSYNTGLSEELQQKAVVNRNCDNNPNSLPCRRTAVSLCHGPDCLADNQLGHILWLIAPQVTLVPFRGKFSFFGKLFTDADITVFLGPAIIGVEERDECKAGSCTKESAFALQHRVTATGTFGLGLNFYPLDYLSFGAEFRLMPFMWNTSGFDNAGSGKDEAFPDNAIDGKDSALHWNPMATVFVGVQLPTTIKISD
jgi:hypothetical protein